MVEYNTARSTIICRFLNETDTSVKSCTVMYGQCDQQLVKTAPGRSTIEAPNYIELRVDPAWSTLDCYIVTASSDTFIVMVEARSGEEPGIVKIYIFACENCIGLTLLTHFFVCCYSNLFVGRLHDDGGYGYNDH